MSIDIKSKTEFNNTTDLLSLDKIIMPLRSVRLGTENLVTRSQAKRVYERFEGLKQVVLDFAEIDEIGPSFADQLFGVFVAEHPEIIILTINACPIVKNMILRASPHYQAFLE